MYLWAMLSHLPHRDVYYQFFREMRWGIAPWQKHGGIVNTCQVRTKVQKDSGSTSGSSPYLPPKSSAQSQTQNQGSDRIGGRYQMEDGWMDGWMDGKGG